MSAWLVQFTARRSRPHDHLYFGPFKTREEARELEAHLTANNDPAKSIAFVYPMAGRGNPQSSKITEQHNR